MSTVTDVLRFKARSLDDQWSPTEPQGGEWRNGVATISPDATVLSAAQAMNNRRIGSVVVVDPDGRVTGMFTERDVLTRVVAAERDPRSTTVREVMTAPVICCTRDTPLDRLRTLMRERRIRHVPVIEETSEGGGGGDGGRLCGIVSIGDLNHAEAVMLTQTITSLEEYILRG